MDLEDFEIKMNLLAFTFEQAQPKNVYTTKCELQFLQFEQNIL